MQSANPELDWNLAQKTLAIVMAGGRGARLGSLTGQHCKPALPFGGQYRSIDFPLSNCVNSGIRRIAVTTQYRAHSLIQHVHRGWSFLRPELGEFVEIWPAQQRHGDDWYLGTADSIRQNLDLIESHGPKYVLVLAGDHVYRMDYLAMIHAHVRAGATATVGCVEVPLTLASGFGVMQPDPTGRITRFEEKPSSAQGIPGNPHLALASMGIYVFDLSSLSECLSRGGHNRGYGHDFGHDILPLLIEDGRVFAHPFRDPCTARQGYWRDIGTPSSYWQANMDLLSERPGIDLHDAAWPLWTQQDQLPPPMFVGAGSASRSIVSPGCRVAGRVEGSVLSPGSRIGAGSRVSNAVIHDNVSVGANCRVDRAIVESGTTIPDDACITPESAVSIAPSGASEAAIAVVNQRLLDQLNLHRAVA